MNTLSIVIALLSFSVMISLALAAWNRQTRWIAFALIPIVAGSIYMGWESSKTLLGLPTNTTPVGEWVLNGGVAVPSKAIYLLVTPISSDVPVFVRYPWTEKQQKKLEIYLQMICEGKTVMGNTRGGTNKEGQNGTISGNIDRDGDFVLYNFNAQSLPPKR